MQIRHNGHCFPKLPWIGYGCEVGYFRYQSNLFRQSPQPTIALPAPLTPGGPIVLPTLAPPTITPTPYIITPPQDFYLGDTAFVGGTSSPMRVRFRLQNAFAYPTSPDDDGTPRRIYAWQLEVKNAGSEDYEIFPALQMYLSEISAAWGTVNGEWGSAQAAADKAGLTIDNEVYTLAPGQTRIFRFAALAPAGNSYKARP